MSRLRDAGSKLRVVLLWFAVFLQGVGVILRFTCSALSLYIRLRIRRRIWIYRFKRSLASLPRGLREELVTSYSRSLPVLRLRSILSSGSSIIRGEGHKRWWGVSGGRAEEEAD